MKTKLRDQLPRFGAEFVVVFVSIVLALVADDCRADRAERADEQELLVLLLRDLEADMAALEQYRGYLLGQSSQVARFLDFVAAGAARDSLLATVNGEPSAVGVWNYRPTYPTYLGLIQSGQLSIIDDPVIRDGLIGYHDEWVAYLNDLRESVLGTNRRARELLLPYLGRVSDGTGDFDWHVAVDASVLAADQEALHALGEAGTSRAWLADRIETLFLPRATVMRDALEDYAAGRSGSSVEVARRVPSSSED